ncbi:hypothetical protein BD770DRAFT_416620 [Pilaira anomala]|nr:hypothetical protein BD770DRAFT_416620 [Pilaira anomala]
MNTEIEFPEPQQMNDEFKKVIFPINMGFPTIVAAKTEAFKFGGIYNVPFVVGRSDPTREYLTLTCKHYGVPRSMRSGNENAENTEVEETEEGYHKDTHKLSCPCYIKFKRSVKTQNISVYEARFEHNHPIPKSSTTYSMYLKQNADTMDTIVKILSLSTSNATEVIMTMLEAKGIKNILKKDIYNLRSKLNSESSSSEMFYFLDSLQSKGYIVRFQINEKNQLKSLFFCHEESIREARRTPESIIIDATYKTNNH